MWSAWICPWLLRHLPSAEQHMSGMSLPPVSELVSTGVSSLGLTGEWGAVGEGWQVKSWGWTRRVGALIGYSVWTRTHATPAVVFRPFSQAFPSLELANYILSPHLIICTIYVTLLSMQLTVEVFWLFAHHLLTHIFNPQPVEPNPPPQSSACGGEVTEAHRDGWSQRRRVSEKVGCW